MYVCVCLCVYIYIYIYIYIYTCNSHTRHADFCIFLKKLDANQYQQCQMLIQVQRLQRKERSSVTSVILDIAQMCMVQRWKRVVFKDNGILLIISAEVRLYANANNAKNNAK